MSYEIDINVVATAAVDEAVAALDRLQSSIDQVGSSASVGMGGFQESTDNASDSMGGFSDSAGLSFGSILTLAYGLNNVIRGWTMYEQGLQRIQTANEKVTATQDTLNDSLYRWTGNQEIGNEIQAEADQKKQEAIDILGQYGTTLDQATMRQQQFDQEQGRSVTFLQAQNEVIDQSTSEVQANSDAHMALSSAYDTEYAGIARLGLGVAGFAGGIVATLESTGNLSGAIGTLSGMLGLGGTTAAESFTAAMGGTTEAATASTGVFEGFASGLADTSAGAEAAGVGLGGLGYAIAPVIVAGRGVIQVASEMYDGFTQGTETAQSFGNQMLTLGNPLLLAGQGIESFMKDAGVIPQQLPSVSQGIGMLQTQFSNLGQTVSTTVTQAFTGLAPKIAAAVAPIEAAMAPVAQTVTSTLGDAFTGVATTVQSIGPSVTQIGSQIATGFGTAFTSAASMAKTAVDSVSSALNGIPTSVKSEIAVDAGGAVGMIEEIVGGLGQIVSKSITIAINYVSSGAAGVMSGNLNMPGFQLGGMVPETGPYILHTGEEVVPANQVAAMSQMAAVTPTSSPSGSSSGGGLQPININATLVMDGQQIAQFTQRYLVNSRISSRT